MSEFGEFLLVIGILVLVFFPDIRVKVIGALVAFFEFYLIFLVQDQLIDAGIDIAEDLNLINIPENYCPNDFNRTDYCVEFGLNKGELTGHAFLSQPVSDQVNLKFETKDKLLNCKLTKDNMCNFAQVKSADDLKISLTDKRGTTILTYKKLKNEIKSTSKILGIAKLLKKLKF